MTGEFLGLIFYLSLMLAIGAWVARRIHSEADYLVAGRSMGFWLVSFSVFATWFGAEAVISTAANNYTDGLAGAAADPFGWAVAIIGAGAVFARALWAREMTTYADLYRQRYGPAVERFAVLLLIPASVPWAAAQIRAFGQVLGVSTGFDLEVTIAIAAAFVMAYTLLGGLLADAITDLVQGAALIAGLIAIFLAVQADAGGVPASLARVETVRLDPFLVGEEGWLVHFEAWSIVVVGGMLTAEIIQRMIGARSGAVALWGTISGGLIYLVVSLVPVYLGLVGPELLPGLDDPEQLVPTLAREHLGSVAFVLFSGALVSMILSTVDSALLTAGGLVSHNVIVRMVPTLGEGGRLIAARACVLVMGIISTWLAIGAERIYDLIILSTAVTSAGLFVTTCFALFTGFGGARSAVASNLAGVAVWSLGTVMGWSAPWLASLAAALVAYVAVASLERARQSPRVDTI
jgi:Na+/proline symporter